MIYVERRKPERKTIATCDVCTKGGGEVRVK